jgi:hypothetical protein
MRRAASETPLLATVRGAESKKAASGAETALVSEPRLFLSEDAGGGAKENMGGDTAGVSALMAAFPLLESILACLQYCAL